MLDISKEDLFVLTSLNHITLREERYEAIRRRLGLLPGDSMIAALAKELLATWCIRKFARKLEDNDQAEWVVEGLRDAIAQDTKVILAFSSNTSTCDDEPF